MTPTQERESAAPTTQDRQSLLDRIAEETERAAAQSAARYMPTLTVKQFSEREKQLRELKEMLVEGVDYGTIPGTEKPTLYLPGAQKICTFFGYVPHYECRQVEDWTGEQSGGEPRFYYDFTCTLFKGPEAVGEGRGSCNSWESKYRFRWVKEDDVPSRYSQEEMDELPTRTSSISEFGFAIDKGETSGQYGKPAEYWQKWRDAISSGEAREIKKKTSTGKMLPAYEMGGKVYRVPNEGYPDIINTVQKMGQKRAYIAATLSATGASQYFTQDLEELDPTALGLDTARTAIPRDAQQNTPSEQAALAQRRIEELTAQAASQSTPEGPLASNTAPPANRRPPSTRQAAEAPAEPIPSLPPHWSVLLAALDARQPNSDKACYDQIEKEVREALPGTGQKFLERIYEANGVYDGGLTPRQIKAVILALLDGIPKSKPTAADPMDYALLQKFQDEKVRLGEEKYRKALKAFGGVDKSNQFTDMKLMAKVLKDLQTIQAPATPTPSGYTATDADVPDIIGSGPHLKMDLVALKKRMEDAGHAIKFATILSNHAFVQRIEDVPDEFAMAVIAEVEEFLRNPKPVGRVRK